MSDFAGNTYEYVTKAELKQPREELEKLINELQEELRENNVTFSFKLVGSAGKHLVTRVVDGNAGFDFDYNFQIQKGSELSARELRQQFKRKLEGVISNTNYSNVSEGKQALTIKVVDHENSRIVHSCDFAIINDFYDEFDDLYQEILVWNRESNSYVWNKRPFGKNYTVKLANLKENGLWQDVKDEYLNLKNNNQDPEKKSFSLFFEAINNVYYRYDWS